MGVVMFRYRLRIALFAFGTIAGFASGIHSMRHCRYERGHYQSYEQHIAKVCADAVRNEK